MFDLLFAKKKGVTRSVALLNSQPGYFFFAFLGSYDERQTDDARDLVTSLTFP